MATSSVISHTYMFIPGRWEGKGVLTIIGGQSEKIGLKMITTQSGDGTITAHLELDFNGTEREGGAEVVYTILPAEGATFRFVQLHSKLGRLHGACTVTGKAIIFNFSSSEGAYSGYEVLEKIDENRYHLRGTLSLNGMPSSVLEATLHRIRGRAS